MLSFNVYLSTSTVGAALVVPYLTDADSGRITIATVTNPTSELVSLHVIAYGNGELDACSCSFDCPLTPHETTSFTFEEDPSTDPPSANVTFECKFAPSCLFHLVGNFLLVIIGINDKQQGSEGRNHDDYN